MFSYCQQAYQPSDIVATAVIKHTKLLQSKLEQLESAVTEIK